MDFDDLDEAEEERAAEEGPPRTYPEWREVPKKEWGGLPELKAVVNENRPGDYFGITFPHSEAQLKEWGPEWLTRAFHAAGTLPRENRVTRIVDSREFVGGGAGLKCIMNVEYESDAPYLHKTLFIKLPHKHGSDRYYVSCLWDHDRPEIVFNIWLSSCVPCRVPKFYFGDICSETTNFILICESIPFAPGPPCPPGLAAGEIEPPYDKFKDWELPAPGALAYYRACVRAMGTMAGKFKQNELFPPGHGTLNASRMFPMPPTLSRIPAGLPGMSETDRAVKPKQADMVVKFIGQTARRLYADDIVDARFLSEWKSQVLHCAEYQQEIGAFKRLNQDYVSLTHNNLQIDNAFFWRDESGEVQVGLLDWGILSCSDVAGSLQGCLTGMLYDDFDAHFDDLVSEFLRAYEEHGGPRLDAELVKLHFHLGVTGWAVSLLGVLTNIFKFTKEAEFETIESMSDPRIMDRFHVRAQTTQLGFMLRYWRRRNPYAAFTKWVRDSELPPKCS